MGITTAGLALLLVSLVEARQGNLSVTLLCAFGAVMCLAAFVVTQIRGVNPMLDPALFRHRGFTAATVAALATGAGIALMSFAPTFLVTGMGLTTLSAAGLLVLWSGTSVASAVLGKRLPARFAGSGQLVIGLAGVSIGLLLLTSLIAESTPWRLVPGLLVAGVATGILNAGLGRQCVATVPPERAALGTATNNTARYISASIGIAVVSVVAAHRSGIARELVAGWNEAALMTAGLSFAGAFVVAVLSRPGTRRREEPRATASGPPEPATDH